MTTRRLAGIDIGTLTCRLLIAELPTHGNLKAFRSQRRILRLGEGVDQSKRLKPEAIDRVLSCLRDWRGVIEDCHVDASTVVATSAVRDAENRQQFVDRVKSEIGLDVEILTGEEEAKRTMLGIRSGLSQRITDVLALDIGGAARNSSWLNRDNRPSCTRSIWGSYGSPNGCCIMIRRQERR